MTVADRVRAEFEEMPGLALTVRQASRLFGLDQEVTRSVMERLVGTDVCAGRAAASLARGDRSVRMAAGHAVRGAADVGASARLPPAP